MDYDLIIDEDVQAEFAAWLRKHDAPDAVLDGFEEALQQFSGSPATLSRPAPCPPFVPGRQMFEWNVTIGRDRYCFNVFFRYSQDETSLLIYKIGTRKLLLPE